MPAGNHQRWQMSARRSDAETRGADKSCGGSARNIPAFCSVEAPVSESPPDREKS